MEHKNIKSHNLNYN